MQRYPFFERNVLFQPACLNRDKLKRHIEGKTVLITGASSGIGERFAHMLAEFKVHLIVVARREERLLALQQAAEAKGAKVSVFPADLRDRQQLEQLLDFLHLPIRSSASWTGSRCTPGIRSDTDEFAPSGSSIGMNDQNSIPRRKRR